MLICVNFAFAQTIDYNPNRDPINPKQKVQGLKIIAPGKKINISLCCNADATNKPLIVVNGEIISIQEFDSIDHEKVKSMTVLKDAKAVEMYGEKGKNGVIVIEAKRNWKKSETSDKKPKEEPILAI